MMPAVLGVLLGLGLLTPEVILPRSADLSASVSDSVELERLAARLGPQRVLTLWLDAVLKRQDRPGLAALRSLGLMAKQEPDWSVQILTGLLTGAQTLHVQGKLNDKLLAPLGESLRTAAESVRRTTTCETPSDGCGEEVERISRRLAQTVRDREQPLPLREHALWALLALPIESWRSQEAALVTLATGTTESSPGLQRLALAGLAMLAQQLQSPALTQLIQSGPDVALAALAAAELCLVTVPKKGTAALSIDLSTRVRALAAMEGNIAARQRLGECLRLLGTPQDRGLWQAIQVAARRTRK